MSILLDALKKSEEQRQLGQAPDIHRTPEPSPGTHAAAVSQWLPFLLVAVAAAVIAMFSWRQYRAPEDPGAMVSEAVSQQPALAERPAAEPETPADQPDGRSAARSPLASYTAPSGEPVTQAAADASEENQRKDLAESFNQYQRPPAESGLQQAGSQDTSTPARTAEPVPAPPTRLTEPDRGGAARTQAVSFWELPQNVRDSMPEIRITVLVYADSSEDRFVLVNGRRMVEQDSLEGVLLDEIRRDGAVFRYRNYQFLVRN